MLFLYNYLSFPDWKETQQTHEHGCEKNGLDYFSFRWSGRASLFSTSDGWQRKGSVLLDMWPGREGGKMGKGADGTNTFSGTAVASSVGKSWPSLPPPHSSSPPSPFVIIRSKNGKGGALSRSNFRFVTFQYTFCQEIRVMDPNVET